MVARALRFGFLSLVAVLGWTLAGIAVTFALMGVLSVILLPLIGDRQDNPLSLLIVLAPVGGLAVAFAGAVSTLRNLRRQASAEPPRALTYLISLITKPFDSVRRDVLDGGTPKGDHEADLRKDVTSDRAPHLQGWLTGCLVVSGTAIAAAIVASDWGTSYDGVWAARAILGAGGWIAAGAVAAWATPRGFVVALLMPLPILALAWFLGAALSSTAADMPELNRILGSAYLLLALSIGAGFLVRVARAYRARNES
jgi:hypothetical protein